MIETAQAMAFDRAQGTIAACPAVERRLSQLRGVFADVRAYEGVLIAGDDPLIYTVTSVRPADGDGQLHVGLGQILPGRIGREYFMTRGHFHQWRAAAEVYVGLSGRGLMLLEDEQGGAVRALELVADSVVYVPGHTAHRTVNTGDAPLTYLGLYPAAAGHDYGALAERNFTKVVIAQDGKAVLLDRQAYLATLAA